MDAVVSNVKLHI